MRNKKKQSLAGIRQNIGDAAPQVAGRFLIRTGGALAANKVVQMLSGPGAPVDLGRASGAVPVLVGIAAELVLKDPYLQALGEGMSALGSVVLFADNAPGNIQKIVGTEKFASANLGNLSESDFSDYYEITEGPYNPFEEQAQIEGIGDLADDLVAQLDAAAEAEGIEGMSDEEDMATVPMIQ